MLLINEQEILVEDLQEVETKLFNLSEQLGSDDELGKAWYIVYNRLKKKRRKRKKRK